MNRSKVNGNGVFMDLENFYYMQVLYVIKAWIAKIFMVLQWHLKSKTSVHEGWPFWQSWGIPQTDKQWCYRDLTRRTKTALISPWVYFLFISHAMILTFKWFVAFHVFMWIYWNYFIISLIFSNFIFSEFIELQLSNKLYVNERYNLIFWALHTVIININIINVSSLHKVTVCVLKIFKIY